jgi:hypothetical protein
MVLVPPILFVVDTVTWCPSSGYWHVGLEWSRLVCRVSTCPTVGTGACIQCHESRESRSGGDCQAI